MSNNCITAEPIRIGQFLTIASEQGFEINSNRSAGINITHNDGRGCYGISEEEHDGEIYIGMMRDPRLCGVGVFESGSNGYNEITGEWDEGEGEDEDDLIDDECTQSAERCFEYRAFDIEWDAPAREARKLPNSVIVSLESDNGVEPTEEEVDERIADAVSDEYGWCINGLKWAKAKRDEVAQ